MDQNFPQVDGSNLLRQNVRLPQDLTAEYNLILIAFQQQQQLEVNTWIPFARQMETEHPDFTYLELPVIRSLNPLARWFINEGMRAGIGEPHALARTITLYLDKDRFRRALAILSEDTIHILLVNRRGEILWRSTGIYTHQKGRDLLQHIQPRQILEKR